MTNEIKEIIRLNCDEEIEVKYFAKDDSIVDTTMDYSQLLDYITNLQEENKHLKWERDSYYEDIICYIKNTMHVSDKKARKTFDKVSNDWSSSTIYLTLCELDKDLRGDE